MFVAVLLPFPQQLIPYLSWMSFLWANSPFTSIFQACGLQALKMLPPCAEKHVLTSTHFVVFKTCTRPHQKTLSNHIEETSQFPH